MASNPGSNGNGQYYRRQLYTSQNSSSSLPPASELLSPSPALPYPNKVRHALHSVASPNLGPPSPYLGPHNTYQTLTEPGTPAFLNPSSVDPAPSPSYESIASPASNNHINQSAGSTKPSTPMAECRASPIPNGYNPGAHYQGHYYQPTTPQYQRLPSVDTLPSSSTAPSSYYSGNNNQMPLPNQPLHHSNVYVRPIDRPSHPVPPSAYMSSQQSMQPTQDTGNVMYPAPPNEDYMNGPQDYYPDPYSQPPPTDSSSTYNPYPPPQHRVYPQTMKQPFQPHLRQPLQRQVVYQQQQQAMQGNSMIPPHVYVQQPGQASYPIHPPPNTHNPYDGSVVDRGPAPVPYIPPQVPSTQSSATIPTPNGTNQQKIDGVVTNATQHPIMSTVPNNQPETVSPQSEKPKKPAPKRNRKTAAQLKAEAAAKAAEQQQQAVMSQQPEELKPLNGGDLDTSSLLMPPPKVAQAPSVVAAAAKAMHSTPTNSNQSTPQKMDQKMSPQSVQSPLNSQETSDSSQQSGAPKRQRTASQRAQQQKARLQKQREVELLKKREEREYLVKTCHLRRTVRALVFKNGALADEVARLKMRIDICREERKMIAKRVQHYERNRIRRAQTHERKALARAAAAQQQMEQKSTDTAEEDENSMDVVLPLNDVVQHIIQKQPTNFHSLTETDPMLSNGEEGQKVKPPTTPRKRSRNKTADSNEHAPAKRRRSNGSTASAPSKPTPKSAEESVINELKLQIPPNNQSNQSQASTSSMDYSPAQKSTSNVFMSPMEEMESSPISREPINLDINADEIKESPLSVQVDTPDSATPVKPAAQLTPTERRKSGESVGSNNAATNDSIRKRFSARLNKGPRQSTPPTPNQTSGEDVISLRTRSASRSQPSSTLSPKAGGRTTPLTALAATNTNTTPSTSSSYSVTSSASPTLQLNTSATVTTSVSTIPAQVSPVPTRETFTRFPTNFLERSETPAEDEEKLDEPQENDFDRPISEQPIPSKVGSDRHLRSNSSTTDSGLVAETRQRTNSRASRRPPRHSMTPSSLADSDNAVSNSASPVPHENATSSVLTRRKAAEIVATSSSTTPPMKTRSKTKIQGS